MPMTCVTGMSATCHKEVTGLSRGRRGAGKVFPAPAMFGGPVVAEKESFCYIINSKTDNVN